MKPGVVRLVFSLTGLLAAVRLAGFVEKQVLASWFGAGDALDHYFVATSVPLMALFCATAVVGPTLVPLFVARAQRGDSRGAWGQFNSWRVVFVAAGGLLGLLCWVFAPTVATLLAPGFDAGRREDCAALIRLLAPSVLVMSILPLTASALNAQRRFAVPPIAELGLKAATLAGLFLLGNRLGVRAAALGFGAGSALALLLHFWKARALSRPHDPPKTAFDDPDFRLTLWLMAAPAAGSLLSRLGGVVENAACSTLAAGAVSELELARRIVNLPLLIVPVACATVLYTVLSELKGQDDERSAAEQLGRGIHFMLFLFLPLTGLTILLSEPVAAVVYQRGRFDADATRRVAWALMWLAPSMGLEAVEMLLMRYFFAQRDVWTPTAVGLGCTAVKIAAVSLLVKPFGIAGVAVGIVAARGLKAAVLMGLACGRFRLPLRHSELGLSLDLLPPLAGCLLTAWFVRRGLAPLMDDSLLGRLALLIAAGGAAGAVYLAIGWLVGLSECRYALRRLAWRTA